MSEEDYTYDDEELDEIDYYEIVSLEDIIKSNPTFIAFSNEEIYNFLFNFFKSKTKAEGFLILFTDIINRQRSKINTKNLIVIADAQRDKLQDINIEDFILKIKNSNKEQIQIAYKNKNKLWFPIVYDEDSTRIKMKVADTTIIDLTNFEDNNKYIIFKDDERDIPVMGVYFYEPSVIGDNYLNEKITSHLNKNRYKEEVLECGNYKSFDELITNYNIKLPLDKIDTDEYYYTNLNTLFKKFNYDLDNIKIKDFEIVKKYLEDLNKNEKVVDIKYTTNNKIKPLHIKNERFYFFQVINDTHKLLNITVKSAKKLKDTLEIYKKDKNYIAELPIIKNLDNLMLNIHAQNYEEIINNLREIRKNISIDNCIDFLEKIVDINIKTIEEHFEKIKNKFDLLLTTYKDIYKIAFTFNTDEHEIKKGNDIKDYEGIPVRIDDFKKNTVYADEENEEDVEETEYNPTDELKKYYTNYYYNLEKGFSEALRIVLPFMLKIKEISKLPINLDIITTHLFNIHRGIPEKFIIVKNKYNSDLDDSYYREQSLKTIKYVLMTDNEDDILKEANQDYMKQIIVMVYDAICKSAIEIQKEILTETLLFIKDRCYIPCIHLWNDYGAPYDMNSKDGVLFYLICIFEDVFKEQFSENDNNYLVIDNDYKNKILNRLKENYKDELEIFNKEEKKKKKENKGLETGKKLVEILKTKENYKTDKFLETFIQALIYMPSYKYEKIHKYLLGCCLEKIDENFSADIYLKINREDIKKAKSKLAEERVLNTSRNLRYFLTKTENKKEKDVFKAIDNFIYYKDLYESSLDDWFINISDNTILSKSNINDIKIKLLSTYNIHISNYLQLFFIKKSDIVKTYNFYNYKQILITISHILFLHLKDDAKQFIVKINETIKELNKLSSIINDDNITDIHQITSIIVIRCMCLPSYPDIRANAKLIPSIGISNDLNKTILNDINKKIFSIIQNSKMPTLEDQINYINNIREENKNKILATLNKKSREEKEILKEIKKIGIQVDEYDDDDNIKINKDVDHNNEEEGEREYEIGAEDDGDENEDNLDFSNYGFIYAD
jgi:hypothetical protein